MSINLTEALAEPDGTPRHQIAKSYNTIDTIYLSYQPVSATIMNDNREIARRKFMKKKEK